MTPTAWRPRHEAFAEAVRGLRRALPERLDPWPALEALDAALRAHIAYEDAVLGPVYARVAPAEGPGSVAAWQRDHDLLRGHLDAVATPVQDAAGLDARAARLARLEGLLEHHDAREARYVLPAVEAEGLVIDLDEAPLQVPPLGPAAPTLPGPTEGLAGLAHALLSDGEVPGPLPEAVGKAARHRAGLAACLAERAAATDRRARREAGVKAYDALARWRWMAPG